jgi:hypothetical protein
MADIQDLRQLQQIVDEIKKSVKELKDELGDGSGSAYLKASVTHAAKLEKLDKNINSIQEDLLDNLGLEAKTRLEINSIVLDGKRIIEGSDAAAEEYAKSLEKSYSTGVRGVREFEAAMDKIAKKSPQRAAAIRSSVYSPAFESAGKKVGGFLQSMPNYLKDTESAGNAAGGVMVDLFGKASGEVGKIAANVRSMGWLKGMGASGGSLAAIGGMGLATAFIAPFAAELVRTKGRIEGAGMSVQMMGTNADNIVEKSMTFAGDMANLDTTFRLQSGSGKRMLSKLVQLPISLDALKKNTDQTGQAMGLNLNTIRSFMVSTGLSDEAMADMTVSALRARRTQIGNINGENVAIADLVRVQRNASALQKSGIASTGDFFNAVKSATDGLSQYATDSGSISGLMHDLMTTSLPSRPSSPAAAAAMAQSLGQGAMNVPLATQIIAGGGGIGARHRWAQTSPTANLGKLRNLFGGSLAAGYGGASDDQKAVREMIYGAMTGITDPRLQAAALSAKGGGVAKTPNTTGDPVVDELRKMNSESAEVYGTTNQVLNVLNETLQRFLEWLDRHTIL